MIYRESHLQAIRFCSLVPMRAVPARVIVLIGMDEGAFPRIVADFSLDLMRKNPDADYCPTIGEYDRYLFLEALLSARDYFILSYQESASTNNPSILVSELIDYLDQSYRSSHLSFSEMGILKHPFSPFDRRYFEPESPFKSYSRAHFKGAKACESGEIVAIKPFITEWKQNEKNQANAAVVSLDLKQLTACARHPIKNYLNQALGIYLDRDRGRQLKDEEDFILTSLDHHLLLKEALKAPVDKVVKKAEKEGKLPHGLFKQVARDKIVQGVEQAKANLKKMGLDPDQLFTVTFSAHCEKPSQTKTGDWVFPAVVVPYRDAQIKLVGKIPHVSAKGIVHIGDHDFDTAIKVFPSYLMLRSLNCDFKQLFMTEESYPKDLSHLHQEHLNIFVDYYFKSLKSVSPLMPSWVESIVKGDASSLGKKLKKALDDPFATYQDEYLKWAIGEELDPEGIIKNWKGMADQVYGKLYRGWFRTEAGTMGT
jgi:exodeoxyribonuclease V gamma subunit